MRWLAGLIATFSLTKAVIMTAAVATLSAGEPFWHQLLLVMISAATSALGMVVAARIGASRVERKLDRTHDVITDVQKAVGADRRDSDD